MGKFLDEPNQVSWIPKAPKRQNRQGEFEEQVKVIEWANMNLKRYPCLKFLHASLNGVRLTIGQAVKAKRGGLKKGVPDLFLPKRARCDTLEVVYSGLYIEMKYGKNLLSAGQIAWARHLNHEGYRVETCYTAKAAIKVIEEYLE